MRYEGTAPLNCAFQTVEIDGLGTKKEIFAGMFSASINVNLGPINISSQLGDFFNLSSVNINDTFEGFVNDDPQNMTRALQTKFSEKYCLFEKGDYFQVATHVKDYGDVATASNDVICRWVMTVTNMATDEVMYETYVISAALPAKVK